MYRGKSLALILPARNEALALPALLAAVPAFVDRVVVVDNGSTDATARIADDGGADVVSEPTPGYGQACLAGIAFLQSASPDIVAFADADGSDDLPSLAGLLDLLAQEEADLALARRVPSDPEALTSQQRFGNGLATFLIRLFWGHRYGDLGPMRTISWDALELLDMRDRGFGWTVEMQIKAIKKGLQVREIPLPYSRRSAGFSKVSRTLMGAVRAGAKILWVIGREALI
jgi:glycosyltransferase involved in cell wall biosynthesis